MHRVISQSFYPLSKIHLFENMRGLVVGQSFNKLNEN